MNRSELISAIEAGTGLSREDSEKALNVTVETITNSLISGDKVQILGFGTFDIKNRVARMGRNPRTKEPIEIPATRIPQFKASRALKEAIAK